MVGEVAKVVETTFSIGEETTGGSTHAIAVGAFDDAGCGRKCGTTDGVVLGAGPKSENDEIGFVGLPPTGVTNVGGGRPENGRDERF